MRIIRKDCRGCPCKVSRGYFKIILQVPSSLTRCKSWWIGVEGPSTRIPLMACIGTSPKKSECRSPKTSGRPSTTLAAGADPQAQRRGSDPMAVSASLWAVRTGHASLQVPRHPVPEYAGRREHWLAIDSRAGRCGSGPWPCPFTSGVDCSMDDWLNLYAEHVMTHLQSEIAPCQFLAKPMS